MHYISGSEAFLSTTQNHVSDKSSQS